MGSIPAGGVRGYIMNIIVMDLEWNQNSLGKKDRDSDKPIFEIIEIGAVKLNEEYKIMLDNIIGESDIIKHFGHKWL